ncbi:MAG TPA: MipA/OmpV family protein [Steroidobacteraceae bacterium]|nr:MipA/OmpV family protein [Steroidobacteraceae bacterium]
MSSRTARASVVVLFAAVYAARTFADEKPLWEAGLGIGALAFPDYRGSDQTRVYPVPVPYLVYRGDFLKADRNGVRGEFFNRPYVELNLSVNATVPVDSNDHARRGMPNLRPTIEAGPSVDFHLWHSSDEHMKFGAVLPLRVPLTIDSSPQFIGWNFSPRLNLDIQDVAGRAGWNLGIGAGPLFAARKYHQYFYSVDPRYATIDRPAYDAKGGYSGAEFISALSKRFPKYWVGAFIRYDALQGAAFEDSPLVKQKYYIAGGIGIAWMIRESARTVEADD